MVPQLWQHMAACDLAVVQGGGTTTLELEALRVPFLFFPIEHHSEQEVTVVNRLSRSRSRSAYALVVDKSSGYGRSYCCQSWR